MTFGLETPWQLETSLLILGSDDKFSLQHTATLSQLTTDIVYQVWKNETKLYL